VTRDGSHWRPGASLAVLRRRAALLATIRAFFAERGVLEVDTPLPSPVTATDPLLESIPAFPFDERERWYLQTSPEFALKRLLAAGSGPVYQLGKAFRRGERGPRHNPEFTMLEWYRPGFDTGRLIGEVADLVTRAIGARPLRSSVYRELFLSHLALDPWQADTAALRERAVSLCGVDATPWERDELLDLLFSAAVEPQLGWECLEFVTGFPASRVSLACLTTDDSGTAVADRFECLRDARELRRRMEADNRCRSAGGRAPVPLDERLLEALPLMPACAGVALGVDRLLMVALGLTHIDEVIGFSSDRA
jgi:elongation factor P--(R)-beta-lysine ligase